MNTHLTSPAIIISHLTLLLLMYELGTLTFEHLVHALNSFVPSFQQGTIMNMLPKKGIVLGDERKISDFFGSVLHTDCAYTQRTKQIATTDTSRGGSTMCALSEEF